MTAQNKKSDSEVKGFFQKIAENEKYTKIIIIVGLIGIVLIFISGYFKNTGSNTSSSSTTQTTISVEQYTKQLETSLTDIVNGIDGAGTAKVLVTLEKGTQYVYATQEKKSTQTTQDQSTSSTTKNQENNNDETTYILVKDANGGQKALAVTEVQPVVKGVVVVCEGGNNPTVQQNVTDAITTALNISSARVCVIKSK
ncbi:MAG TPA: stage III sporulation protein AG [Oscillospiraceae bacterium]|nr:stage III sporulation protein AG [Oscillospiraceae bacterium]